MFCNYSVIAFHEVFDNMLTGTHTTEPSDLSLLTAASDALRLLSHPDKPCSYCTRLHKNFKWCTEIATLIHASRKRPYPNPNESSGSNLFDINAAGVFDTFEFSHKDTSAHFPTARARRARDLEGDFRMDDGFQAARVDPSSTTLTATSSSFNPNDMNSFQSTFNTDLFGNNSLDPKAIDMPDPLLAQPTDIPFESSDQFQDALQWVFDKGNDLDSSFQQIMSGQGMPMVPIGDDGR